MKGLCLPLTHPPLVLLLLVISGYICSELRNKHITLEFPMLSTLQLYFDSFFIKADIIPNTAINFGIQPITFMGDERVFLEGLHPSGNNPHHPTQTSQGV